MDVFRWLFIWSEECFYVCFYSSPFNFAFCVMYCGKGKAMSIESFKTLMIAYILAEIWGYKKTANIIFTISIFFCILFHFVDIY